MQRKRIIPGSRSILALMSLACLALSGAGCSACYVVRQGYHEARILLARQPVEELVASNTVERKVVERLELAGEVKRFAEAELGLARTGNYSSYVDIGKPYVVSVLTACPKDKLDPVRWSFPIVGKVSYLGFFNHEDAVRKRDRFETEGYDTYLRGSTAFSTLGWFDDPILSTMIAYGEERYINTIIHELTHATVYIKGQTRFNENIATFVGNEGSILYISSKYGRDSDLINKARAARRDDRLFSDFISDLYEDLGKLYARGLEMDEVLRLREEIFEDSKAHFREIASGLETDSYGRFERVTLNNAIILSWANYYKDLSLYERAYKKLGADLKGFVSFIVDEVSKSDDPEAFLTQWTDEEV
ncbi:aminopeptidase [Thermodesulfobacteriota bacterium]